MNTREEVEQALDRLETAEPLFPTMGDILRFLDSRGMLDTLGWAKVRLGDGTETLKWRKFTRYDSELEEREARLWAMIGLQ